jgi:hypothetical protein
MHAAMDRRGIGMPCGLVARFAGKTTADVETAIEAACQRFPVLQRRLVWLGSGPALVLSDPPLPIRDSRSELSLGLRTDFTERWWRYRLVADGGDVWLMGIWAHAAADGPSMLRLLQTIGAVLRRTSVPSFPITPVDRIPRRSLLSWFPRFAIEQHLHYVHLSEQGHPPGVAWLTVSPELSASLCAQARKECGSFGAWLGAAACTGFREQQGAPNGRVLLNLPIINDRHERFGGFGFGSSSVIMSLKPKEKEPLPVVARGIAVRQRQMIDQGWHANFERFLGNNPKRHLRFAALRARNKSAPMVTVSWKGDGWRLGDKDGIGDVACFANSTTVHVSSHVDQNGLSVSVTSAQSPATREDLLRRIIIKLGANPLGKVLTYSGQSIEAK